MRVSLLDHRTVRRPVIFLGMMVAAAVLLPSLWLWSEQRIGYFLTSSIILGGLSLGILRRWLSTRALKHIDFEGLPATIKLEFAHNHSDYKVQGQLVLQAWVLLRLLSAQGRSEQLLLTQSMFSDEDWRHLQHKLRQSSAAPTQYP